MKANISSKIRNCRKSDKTLFDDKESCTITADDLNQLIEQNGNICQICKCEMKFERYTSGCLYQFMVHKLDKYKPYSKCNVFLGCKGCKIKKIGDLKPKCKNGCHPAEKYGENGKKFPMILVFDCETTGLPPTYDPTNLGSYDYCRLLEVGYILYDLNEMREIYKYSAVVLPDDFEICATEIHGITQKICDDIGISIYRIFEEIESVLPKFDVFVAHNVGFDVKVLLSEMHRYGRIDLYNKLSSKKLLCTSKIGSRLPEVKRGKGKIKLEKLISALSLPCVNTHRAMSDTQACLQCLIEMHRRDILEFDYSAMNIPKSPGNAKPKIQNKHKPSKINKIENGTKPSKTNNFGNVFSIDVDESQKNTEHNSLGSSEEYQNCYALHLGSSSDGIYEDGCVWCGSNDDPEPCYSCMTKD